MLTSFFFVLCLFLNIKQEEERERIGLTGFLVVEFFTTSHVLFLFRNTACSLIVLRRLRRMYRIRTSKTNPKRKFHNKHKSYVTWFGGYNLPLSVFCSLFHSLSRSGDLLNASLKGTFKEAAKGIPSISSITSQQAAAGETLNQRFNQSEL